MKRIIACIFLMALVLCSCSSRTTDDFSDLILVEAEDYSSALTLIDSNNNLANCYYISDGEMINTVLQDDVELPNAADLMWAGGSNGVTIGVVNKDMGVYGGIYEAVIIEEGSIIKRKDIPEIDGAYFVDACFDIEGNLYVTNGIVVAIYDKSLDFVDSYRSNDMLITSIDSDCSGEVFFSAIEYTGDGFAYLSKIDKNGTVDQLYRISNVVNNGDLCLLGISHGYKDGIVVLMDNSIYKMQGDSLSRILSFSDVNITTVLNRTLQFTDGALQFWGKYGSLENLDKEEGLFQLEFKPIEENRTVISLGIFRTDVWLNYAVSSFNRTNTKYKIELVMFYDSAESFAASCLSGNGPDFIYADIQHISLMDSNKNLVDINSICNFDASEFIESAWTSQLGENGELYKFAPFVAIQAMYTSKENGASNYDFNSIEGFIDFLESTDGYSHIYRDDELRFLHMNLMPTFLSKVESSGEFSKSDYKALLNFISNYSSAPHQETRSVANQLNSGELLFVNPDVGSFLQYVLLNEYFSEDPDCLGMPYTASPVFKADQYFAVFDNSESTEGIAEFFDFMLTDEVMTYSTYNDLFYLPITQSALENNIQRVLWFYSNGYVTDDGIRMADETESCVMSLPLIFYSDGDSPNDNNGNVDYYHRFFGPTGRRLIDNPEDYIDAYYQLIDSTSGIIYYNAAIETLVNEEASALFNGVHDIEYVADVTANRAQTVINERK